MERSSSVERGISKQIPEGEKQQYGFILLEKESVIIARIVGNRLEILSKRKFEIPSERKLNLRLDLGGEIWLDAKIAFRNQMDMFKGFTGVDSNDLHKAFDGFTLASTHALLNSTDLVAWCNFYFLPKTYVTQVVVDIGGERGLHEAIKLSPYMKDTRFMEEIVILKRFFKEVSEGRYSLGAEKTMEHLTGGKVDTLFISDQLLIKMYVLKNGDIMYELPNLDLEILEEHLLLDWITSKYEDLPRCNIEIVGSTSDLGHQFLKGLGGIGAILVEGATEDTVDDEEVDDDAEMMEDPDDG